MPKGHLHQASLQGRAARRCAVLPRGDSAEVVAVEYYGHDVRYELRLDDGSTLAARTTTTAVHERGDTVCVQFSGTAAEAWPVGSAALA